MRVAHADTHITHAVIGGKKSMDFGISDDPAFFQILSSALYKDPMLAMVRETICNAWDAHLESGRTDTPIQITLTDDYLTITDFGPGIPEHLIQPIYGVYGASTKKNDGRQTGGFGLGCKSPFAYNDHFEVTSCYQGTKTIYNMSKSSAQVAGKPAIKPIASFPTTETGISVKIPLNPGAANHRLPELIRQVVFNGDIKAKYNSGDMQVLGMDQAPHGLIMIPETGDAALHHLRNNRQRIYVRYGNVIYPVEFAEAYSDLWRQVDGLLKSHYSCYLVMMAPADSISMTPSRESLTQSDITVATIKSLLGKFLSIFLKNQRLLFRHNELVHEYIDAEAQNQEKSLLDKINLKSWIVPGIPDEINESVLSTEDQFAKLDVLIRYSRSNQGIKPKKWFGYIQRYLHKINKSNLFDQGLMMSWARWTQKNLRKISSPNQYRDTYTDRNVATEWWQRKVLAPLVQLFSVVPNFHRGNLFYVSPHTVNYENYDQESEVQRVSKVRIRNHLFNLTHLLTPTVILCHNANLVPRRLTGHTHEWQGSILRRSYFVYEVGRKQDALKGVVEAFSSLPGIEFLDMTGRLPHEQKAYEERQAVIAAQRAAIAAGRIPNNATLVPKKVKKGYVSLSNLRNDTTQRIDTRKFIENRDPDRVLEPEVALIISTRKESSGHVAYMTRETSYALAKLFGDRIAISNKTDAIVRMHEKHKNIKEINAFLKLHITDVIENSPSMQAFHEVNPDKVKDYLEKHCCWTKRDEVHNFIKMLMAYPELAHLLPNVHKLDADDQLRWLLWNHIKNQTNDPDIAALVTKINSIPLKPELAWFIDKLIANPLIESIKVPELKRVMADAAQNPLVMQKVNNLLTALLT